MDMHRTEVIIGNQRFAIRGDEPEGYIQRVAEYVDKTLADIQTSGSSLDSYRQVILTALNIADQLLKMEVELMRVKVELAQLQKESPAASAKSQPSPQE